MLFNKPTSVSETAEKTVSADSPPVYLAGFNPLSLYLAACFSAAGQRAVILNDSPRCRELVKSELTVKEDRLLQRRKVKIESSFWIRENPKMLIITSSPSHLRSDLLYISPAKLSAVPVIAFNPAGDLIGDYLQTPLIQGYFNGYLSYEKHLLTILGRQTSLELALPVTDSFYPSVAETFLAASVDVEFSDSPRLSFWNNFIPHTVASLLSAAYAKNIYNLTKDERERTLIDQCLRELIALAAAENIDLDAAALLKKIYNIPSSYVSPLQESVQRREMGELSAISSQLRRFAGTDEVKYPQIRAILKIIYDKILA